MWFPFLVLGLDACQTALAKKMAPGENLLDSDYFVPHSGTGMHIIKRAFFRFLRNIGE